MEPRLMRRTRHQREIVNSGGIMPINAATHRYYSGINILILWATREECHYPTPEWMTFKQAREKGGYVRKGEKGTAVVFAKPHTFNEGEDDERKMFMHRVFYVFNLAQIEGLLVPTEVSTPIHAENGEKPTDGAMLFIDATKADIRIGGDVAAFIPSHDYIKMPPMSAFESTGSYYATNFHELGHWSGAEKRLDRNLTTRFGTEAYAAEELVAELTSAFLCAELGVQGELRHAGYLANWLTLLRSDPRAIFTASSKASQAAHYLRSFSRVADIEADQ
jgi:antirestriction protein ArdC